MQNRSLWIIVGILGAGIAALILLVLTLGWLVGMESSPASAQPSGNGKTQSVPGTLAGSPDAPVSQQDYLTDAFEAYADKDKTRLAMASKQAQQGPLSSAERQLLDALNLSLNEDVDRALQLLHSAANDPVVKPQALAYAGELLFLKGDMQNAEAVLRAALLENPNQPNLHRYLAAYYYDVGAMDNALLHLEHVARLDPEDARPWRMRGVILADFERHPEAIEAYRKALEHSLQPHVEQEVRTELATSLLAARQPQAALEQLKQCGATAELDSLRAECFLSLGDYPSAKASLQAALKADPAQARALMTQATLARELGDLPLAEETLQRAVELHPFEFDFRAQLMSVLAALGHKEAAEEQRLEMERLQGLRAKFTELHHQSMRDPGSAPLRYDLGQTAEQLGKLEMAASWYQAALALDPQYEAAERAYQAVVKKLGQE